MQEDSTRSFMIDPVDKQELYDAPCISIPSYHHPNNFYRIKVMDEPFARALGHESTFTNFDTGIGFTFISG